MDTNKNAKPINIWYEDNTRDSNFQLLA